MVIRASQLRDKQLIIIRKKKQLHDKQLMVIRATQWRDKQLMVIRKKIVA